MTGSECDINSLVKVEVEIKQEPKDSTEGSYLSQNDFDFIHPFEFADDAISSNADMEYVDVSTKKERTPKNLKRQKYGKLTVEERKAKNNRGIRRAKEAIKITTGKKKKEKI